VADWGGGVSKCCTAGRSLVWSVDGRMTVVGIISSCQSAATIMIVQRSRICVSSWKQRLRSYETLPLFKRIIVFLVDLKLRITTGSSGNVGVDKRREDDLARTPIS